MKDEDYKWRKLIDGWPEPVDRLHPCKIAWGKRRQCSHRYVTVFVSGPPISGTVRCNDCEKDIPDVKVVGVTKDELR